MLNPKPATIALVGADAEFAKNAVDGARAQAKRAGYKIVYDQTYPPTTADYTPIYGRSRQPIRTWCLLVRIRRTRWGWCVPPMKWD